MRRGSSSNKCKTKKKTKKSLKEEALLKSMTFEEREGLKSQAVADKIQLD